MRHSGKGDGVAIQKMTELLIVMPAKAGNRRASNWTPAFAGVALFLNLFAGHDIRPQLGGFRACRSMFRHTVACLRRDRAIEGIRSPEGAAFGSYDGIAAVSRVRVDTRCGV